MSAASAVSRKRWAVVALAAGGALVAAVWFFTVGPLIFMGDDIATMEFIRQDGLLRALASAPSAKWRPVADIAWAFAGALFRWNFDGYVALNVVIEVASMLVFARTAWLLTRGRSRAMVVAAALSFVLCRFAYFLVLQVVGLMENLAMLLFLLLVHDAVVASTRRSAAALFRTALWFFLIVNTHERFLALLPFLFVLGLSFRGYLWYDKPRIGYLFLLVAVAVSNYVVKADVLRIDFFTGTGGKSTHVDEGSLAQMWAGLCNVLGFSVGPQHLVGVTFADSWPGGVALGCAFTALLLVTLAMALPLVRRAPARDVVTAVLLFGSLFVPLLFSAAITAYQELRWLYAPYAVLLLALLGLAAALPVSSTALRVWTGSFLVISLLTAVYYRGLTHNIYFVYEMAFVNQLKHEIVDQRYEQRPTIILTHGNGEYRTWALQSGAFFDIYANHNPVTVDFAPDAQRVHQLLRIAPNARVLDAPDPAVTDVTAQVLADEAARTRNAPLSLADSRIVAGADPPGAAPVVTLPFGDAQVSAVVVPPGASLQLPDVPVARSAAFRTSSRTRAAFAFGARRSTPSRAPESSASPT